MKHPLQDVVVVLPGIMGSALADESGHEVWGTSLGTLAKGVLTGAKAIKRLQLPDGIGDDPRARRRHGDAHARRHPRRARHLDGHGRLRPPAAVVPRTFDVVEAGDDLGRVVNLAAVSVRLAPVEPVRARGPSRRSSSRCSSASEAEPGNADAKVVFVAHSMGGLVVRYFTDVLGGHEITRQGDHPRHAAPRCAERARLAGQRGAQGHGVR